MIVMPLRPGSHCTVCGEPLSATSGWEGDPDHPLCAPCAGRRIARRRWEGDHPPYGIRVVPRLEFLAEAQPLLLLEVRPHDRLAIRARLIDFSASGLGLRVPDSLMLGQELVIVGQAANVRRATASWRGRVQWIEPAQPGLWDAGVARLEALHADLFLLLSQILASVSP